MYDSFSLTPRSPSLTRSGLGVFDSETWLQWFGALTFTADIMETIFSVLRTLFVPCSKNTGPCKINYDKLEKGNGITVCRFFLRIACPAGTPTSTQHCIQPADQLKIIADPTSVAYSTPTVSTPSPTTVRPWPCPSHLVLNREIRLDSNSLAASLSPGQSSLGGNDATVGPRMGRCSCLDRHRRRM